MTATALVLVDDIREVITFDQQKVDDYLKKIRDHELSIVSDISTEEGRKEVASRAHKIARAKTAIAAEADKLKTEAENKVKAVRKERDRIWDAMEEIQHEVRKPLTEWQDREKTRVEALQAAVDKIVNSVNFEGHPTTAEIKARLDSLDVQPTDWQEFKIRADIEYKKAKEVLTLRYNASEKYDQDQIELARLQAAETARLQKEREEKIAAEAAAKAKADAEAKAKQEAEAAAQKAAKEAQEAADKAKAEQDRIEAERVAAEQRAAKAEADRLAAVAKAEQDAQVAAHKAEQERITAERNAQLREEAAAQKVRDDAAAKQAAEDKATAEREANLAHKKKVNNEAMKAMQALFPNGELHDALAKAIIVAIAKGEIPHTKIAY